MGKNSKDRDDERGKHGKDVKEKKDHHSHKKPRAKSSLFEDKSGLVLVRKKGGDESVSVEQHKDGKRKKVVPVSRPLRIMANIAGLKIDNQSSTDPLRCSGRHRRRRPRPRSPSTERDRDRGDSRNDDHDDHDEDDVFSSDSEDSDPSYFSDEDNTRVPAVRSVLSTSTGKSRNYRDDDSRYGSEAASSAGTSTLYDRRWRPDDEPRNTGGPSLGT